MSDETQGTAEGLAQDTTAAQVADQGTEQQQVTEKPEGEQQAEQAGEQPEGEQEKERKRLSGAEKAKRRQTFLLNQLAEKDRQLEELRRQGQRSEGGDQARKAPKEEDFKDDYAGYIAARAAYEAAEAVEGRLSARETRDQEVKEREAVRERDMAHMDRIEEAREVITDYDQVMAGMKGVNVRDELIEEIKASDKSALLAYHLAKNRSELDTLNSMSGRELARAVGRLEASLKMPAAKKITTAPPPPSKVTGGAQTTFDPATADMNSFAEWLNKDLAKRAGRA